jgi:acetyl/propionyl-CoA carboxylase alpha subunit
MKRYFIEHESNWYWVWALKNRDQIWYHWKGQSFVTTLHSENKVRGSKQQKSGSGEVKAPMPGKIMKVMKAQGAPVKTGDVIIVMEAMKMEYSLEADKDGQVDVVNVKEGQQVSVGEILAIVKS